MKGNFCASPRCWSVRNCRDMHISPAQSKPCVIALVGNQIFVKCMCHDTCAENFSVISCSSDAENWRAMQFFYVHGTTLSSFRVCRRTCGFCMPKNSPVLLARFISFCARHWSETHPPFRTPAAVARPTFPFCWLNLVAGFRESIPRNCIETQTSDPF